MWQLERHPLIDTCTTESSSIDRPQRIVYFIAIQCWLYYLKIVSIHAQKYNQKYCVKFVFAHLSWNYNCILWPLPCIMEKLNYERMSRNMLQHKLNASASTYYNLNETISISSPSSSSTQKQTATFRLHFRAAIFLPLGSKFRVNFSTPSAREPTMDLLAWSELLLLLLVPPTTRDCGLARLWQRS